MYKLIFGPDQTSDRRYQLLQQSTLVTDKKIPQAQWETVVSLQKKFKAIGSPTENIKGVFFYSIIRTTPEQSFEVALENPEFVLLIECFNETPWNTQVIEQVLDIQRWLLTLKPEMDQNGIRVVP